MNDQDLTTLLKQAQAPERTPSYWEDFPGAVSRALRRPRTRVTGDGSHWSSWFWKLGLAGVFVCIGFLVGVSHQRSVAREKDLAQARTMLAEVESLFPKQLRAIIVRNGRSQLVLSEGTDVVPASPVFLRICGQTGCEKIITFSGQQIQINGQPCDVLIDTAGKVIVAGTSFVWSSESTPRIGDVRIQGEVL